MPKGHLNPIVARVCACGCGSTFYTKGRRKCLDATHMMTWRERRFEFYKAKHFNDARRKKFQALISRTLAGGTVKESQILALCQECWRMGYDSGYQKMFKRVKRGLAA